MEYAIVDEFGVATAVVALDDEITPPQHFIAIDPTAVQEGMWTSDDGATWNQPPAPHTSPDIAQQNLQTMANDIASWKNQIDSDFTLWSDTAPGTPLSQDHIDSMGRIINGFSTILDAIMNHAIYTGAIPPD